MFMKEKYLCLPTVVTERNSSGYWEFKPIFNSWEKLIMVESE